MIVVIEGLDATGKSTLCNKLALAFDGIVYPTPPKNFLHQRNYIDSISSPKESFQFYEKALKLATSEIRDIGKKHNVFVDRHWVSTAATHLAMGVPVNVDNMFCYHVADLTILLNVEQSVQGTRFKDRGMTKGDRNLVGLYQLVREYFDTLVVNYCSPHAIIDTSLMSISHVFYLAVSKIHHLTGEKRDV